MNPLHPRREDADMGSNTPCHGVFECLRSGSIPWRMSPVLRIYQKFASYLTWWLENMGWRGALRQIVARGLCHKTGGADAGECGMAALHDANDRPSLGLQPSELVEVRPIEEILATLNRNRRCKGLLWMTGMRKFCGKRYRVYRRVERIMLETNGELRRMRNTVLLEGVTCDGEAFGGCNRSCFHFWREVWLKRVPVGPDESGEGLSATEDSHHGDVKNQT